MTREPFIAYSELTNEIYIVSGREKYRVTEQAIKAVDAIKALKQEPKWIPCSERLPKENEYIGNVRKYYLIQDEYGDMHVAHLSSVGWIPMKSLKAIDDEIIAWRELPQVYVPDINVGKLVESEDKE